MDVDHRREQLNSWIVETRRTQKRLAVGVSVGEAIALLLMLWRPFVGGILFAIIAIVALCGFWITSSHVLDWKTRITELGKARPVGRAGRR